MSPAVALIFFGLLLGVLHSSVSIQMMSCDFFSYGETFSSNQALGVWYIIPMEFNKPDDAQCIEFSKITELERADLRTKLSDHVPDLKLENLVLKMQMPCWEEKSWTDPSVKTNRSKDYFLEKLDVDGKYKTLLIPAAGQEADASAYGRQEMHLKMVHTKYLAALDCQGAFTYILNHKPLIDDKELDPFIMKFSTIYWGYNY